MGGSGSSGGRPSSGSGGSGKRDRCNIRFQTDLFSPVATVVARLDKGDVLDVNLYTENSTTSVAALTPNKHEVAGTITAVAELGQLVACLREGEQYQAQVVRKSGSAVTVIVARV